MPRDGSGVYTAPAGTSGVFGQPIDPVAYDNFLADLANAITQSLPVTGVAPMTANFPFGGNKGINLATPTVSTDAVNKTYADNLPQYGGLVNKLRNGTMDIWQRGTSINCPAGTPTYTADGWYAVAAGAAAVASQQAGRLYTQNCLRITGAASLSTFFAHQRIEGKIVAPLTGQICTFQGWLYNSTGSSITPSLTVLHANALDNWGAATTDINAVALPICPNGQWTQIAYSFTASASAANGLQVQLNFGNALNGVGNYIQLTELDLRATPAATSGAINGSPPPVELRPITAEFPFCQRYFATSYDNNLAPGIATAAGALETVAYTGSSLTLKNVRFPVPMMKTNPTIIIYSTATGASGKWRDNTSSSDANAVAADAGMNGFSVSVAGGAVSGHDYTCHYSASAEL